MSSSYTPLQPVEQIVKTHALLSSIGFLILLPIGVLVARYIRTYTNQWWYSHATIQLVISGPVIYAGWRYGRRAATELGNGHYFDIHTKMGLALLILYVIQLVWGLGIHYIKFPSLFGGRRPPQNYWHVFMGLVIFMLAQYQVYNGLYIEWPTTTGGLHVIPASAKHAWIALIVIFWVLYLGGFALLPRQFKQEGSSKREKDTMTSIS